jgi:hypothetical protein
MHFFRISALFVLFAAFAAQPALALNVPADTGGNGLPAPPPIDTTPTGPAGGPPSVVNQPTPNVDYAGNTECEVGQTAAIDQPSQIDIAAVKDCIAAGKLIPKQWIDYRINDTTDMDVAGRCGVGGEDACQEFDPTSPAQTNTRANNPAILTPQYIIPMPVVMPTATGVIQPLPCGTALSLANPSVNQIINVGRAGISGGGQGALNAGLQLLSQLMSPCGGNWLTSVIGMIPGVR